MFSRTKIRACLGPRPLWHDWLELAGLSTIGAVRNPFEDVAGLTIEHSADGVESRQAHGLRPRVLENRDVRDSDTDSLASWVTVIFRLASWTSRLMTMAIRPPRKGSAPARRPSPGVPASPRG